MPARGFRKLVYAGIVVVALLTTAFAHNRPRARTSIAIPTNTLLQIIRAEDQRRWDDKLKSLLSDKDPKVRRRAALAAGRIGDEGAVLPLIDLLKKDTDWGVQQMAAFALGEIESAKAADALIEASRISDLRARALEALGKIAATLPPTEAPRRQAIGQVVLDALVIERKEAMPTEGGGAALADPSTWSCGAVWSGRRPVKAEAAGSNPVRTALRGTRHRPENTAG